MYLLFFLVDSMTPDFVETFGPEERFLQGAALYREQERVPVVPSPQELPLPVETKKKHPCGCSVIVTDTRTNKPYVNDKELVVMDHVS